MDSERTLRRPPCFTLFSPRPVVVKLRMRSPPPGTPAVSLGCCDHFNLQQFLFNPHLNIHLTLLALLSAAPNPSPVCHLVTSIHSMTPRPCQLYFRPVPPRYGYIPNNTSAVSVSLAFVSPDLVHPLPLRETFCSHCILL